MWQERDAGVNAIVARAVFAGADWLDQASAEALQFAARRLEAEGVAFVFTARTSEGARLDARGLEEIELAGLEAVGGA